MEVKIWSLCSVSSTLSHANLEQPFRTLEIKWEVNIFLKKSSCFVSFLRLPSFMRLNYGVVVMLHEHVNDYITIAPMFGKVTPPPLCYIWCCLNQLMIWPVTFGLDKPPPGYSHVKGGHYQLDLQTIISLVPWKSLRG